FLNLSLNAIQAMPQGGDLHVETGIRRYRTRRSVIDVSFRDTGVGIPRELMEKIFDPFFTTRSMGTGLGLPVSVQIMREAGGVVITAFGDVQSAVDAMKLGACDFLRKPYEMEDIVLATESAGKNFRQASELDLYRRQAWRNYSGDEIIGRSGPMRDVREVIEKV